MRENIDELTRQISKRPTDMLALGRTIMASERTLLGYIRTAVGFLAGGIGIIMYFNHPVLIAIGVVLIIASLLIITLGFKNYRNMQKILSNVYGAMKSQQET
jgi:putative membrane protein